MKAASLTVDVKPTPPLPDTVTFEQASAALAALLGGLPDGLGLRRVTLDFSRPLLGSAQDHDTLGVPHVVIEQVSARGLTQTRTLIPLTT